MVWGHRPNWYCHPWWLSRSSFPNPTWLLNSSQIEWPYIQELYLESRERARFPNALLVNWSQISEWVWSWRLGPHWLHLHETQTEQLVQSQWLSEHRCQWSKLFKINRFCQHYDQKQECVSSPSKACSCIHGHGRQWCLLQQHQTPQHPRIIQAILQEYYSSLGRYSSPRIQDCPHWFGWRPNPVQFDARPHSSHWHH